MKYGNGFSVECPDPETGWGKLLCQIKPGSHVLECGSAQGYMTRYMRDELSCKVCIVEYEQAAFDIAKEYAEYGVCGDLMRDEWLKEFQSLRFDYILFADVLEHLYDPVAVLQKSVGLLKDDGTVLASIPNIAHNDVLCNLFSDNWHYTSLGLLDSTHIRFFARNNLADFFSSAGLVITRLEHVYIPTMQTEQSALNDHTLDEDLFRMLRNHENGEVYQFVIAAQRAADGRNTLTATPLGKAQPTEISTVAYHNLIQYATLEKALKDCRAEAARQCAELQLQNETEIQKHQSELAEMESRIESLAKMLQHTDKELAACKYSLHASLAAYQDISDAFCWKLTKPLRRTLDVAKRTLRGSKAAHFIWNELKRLKDVALRKRSIDASSNEPATETVCDERALSSYAQIDILTTKHTLFVAKLIKRQIELANKRCDIHIEQPRAYADIPYIIICPQMFSKLPPVYIAFQMEQSISTRWLNEKYLETLNNANVVFDYSLVNIEYLLKHGISRSKLYYLPIDYLHESAGIPEKQTYDVLFYGDINCERRKRMLDAIGRHYPVKILSEVFGEQLENELRKARVIVNIHYYEDALLESTRIYEVLSLNSCIIVSERSTDTHEDEKLYDIVDFVDIDNVEQMIGRIGFWLVDEDRRRNKLDESRAKLSNRNNEFDFFFGRFLLAQEMISFEDFFHGAGSRYRFNGTRICLSLAESIERRAEFLKESDYGFELFPGFRHKRGWTGCGLSYKFIMLKALEQEFDSIIVCEDDVYFPPDFSARFSVAQQYLLEQSGWDVFSGLIADVNESVQVECVSECRGECFVHIDKLVSTVFNIYSKQVFEHFRDWDCKNDDVIHNTIDRYLESYKLHIITTIPFLVGHKEGLFSTIWGHGNEVYREMIDQSSKKLRSIAVRQMLAPPQ